MTATDLGRTPIPAPQTPVVKRRQNRSFPALRTIAALMLREMAARYGRSPGGFIWAFLNPLIMVVVLSVMVAVVGRQPRYGDSFLMYFASGHLVFGIFGSIQGSVTSSLQYSQSLLQFPAVTWIDTILSRFFLSSLISVIVFFMLIYLIAIVTGSGIHFDVVGLLESVLMACGVAFGFGVLTQYLFLEISVLSKIWGFLSRPLFIASGVLIMYDDMPDNLQAILYWNPLLHVVATSRAAIFARYDPSWVNPLYVWIFSGITAVLGLILVRKHYDRLLNKDD